ncbi:Acetyltransferase (GNAT) family protein [Agromyces sp. CF514]|uniref:GNAT family N-acetyltransferase n=1 Tax=Agromyces sp. CF514 TaxID=1881031 RepID=UPI0008EC5ABE|nr:GNAT family N-acetyltransferase [Agromyces sp. CF514]SFR68981.1 Acetyltransferase (GNAT) family protein [Agromyces sp. CF514]
MRHREPTIRTTREEDWRQVRELRLEMLQDTPLAFGETYEHALGVSEAVWRMRAARGTTPGQTSVVAIDRDRWVGHMGGWVPDAASGPLLVGVYVSPAYRGDGRGVSRRLLEAVEEWALGHGDALRLEVHEQNPRAIAFYEKLGFSLTGHSRAYELEPGGLELEMIKRLR